jgi:hypothetical protein
LAFWLSVLSSRRPGQDKNLGKEPGFVKSRPRAGTGVFGAVFAGVRLGEVDPISRQETS